MKNSSLSTRALLVAVNISQWTGRRIDQKATNTANAAHKANSQAGAYHKRLLPGAAELELVSTIVGQARQYFYAQTLPWMTDGSRIISSKNYMKFTAEFRKIKTQFETAVKDFEAAYPRLQSEAKKSLGDLYDGAEYPSQKEISSKFAIEVNYLPLPDVKDFRVQVSEAEKRDFVKKMREVEAVAMRDCWNRLHGVVKAAAEKLQNPKAIFRDSLIENINEIVALLPSLNVGEDKALEDSRREVEALVSKLSTESLRENKDTRSKAAKSLSEIESKMGAYMGVSK